jgi:formylglycine-generating enzyme
MTWPAADRWRAPVADWPPLWASSWGSDRRGLWADLIVNGVTQRLRWIEPSGPEGFLMGDPGEQLHKMVESGFWLADTPCTQAFWVQVAELQVNPSQFQQGDEAGQRPVERVSWDDAQQWLARLAQWCPATAGLAALPTEVQWEYACRAGTTTAYWWGDEFDQTRANADVVGDRDLDGSKGATTPVKRHAPNPWGLHDMHGNVWEWCDDVWRERLDGVGEGGSSGRAVRGGSWFHHPGDARSAVRYGWPRDDRILLHGFRFALRSPSPVPAPEVFGPEGRAR